jgi:hypothetical protein
MINKRGDYAATVSKTGEILAPLTAPSYDLSILKLVDKRSKTICGCIY